MEEQTFAQGKRFRAAAAAASALAYRRFLHQPVRHLHYLCSILDGFSRFLVHWDLRESMREADVEVILQRAKEESNFKLNSQSQTALVNLRENNFPKGPNSLLASAGAHE